ncbi:MAG: hypothetical protein P4L36_19745 [Holophaga sp.]|nr:hypothetical protein [Holophaga sp.]
MFKPSTRLSLSSIAALAFASMANASGFTICGMCNDPQMQVELRTKVRSGESVLTFPGKTIGYFKISKNEKPKKLIVRFSKGTSKYPDLEITTDNITDYAYVIIKDGSIDCYNSDNKILDNASGSARK